MLLFSMVPWREPSTLQVTMRIFLYARTHFFNPFFLCVMNKYNIYNNLTWCRFPTLDKPLAFFIHNATQKNKNFCYFYIYYSLFVTKKLANHLFRPSKIQIFVLDVTLLTKRYQRILFVIRLVTFVKQLTACNAVNN